jgi:2-oxoglutarate ferredoxin oxidoreductase subunit alpha
VFTTSSSPGISLMSEGHQLHGWRPVPAVFVNIMRGGPGLGGILPSQADYNQATKGGIGHGDYRLLVMAPASVQEAVEMVMKAFPLAEKYRNPVMILGDGLIGQMMEPVEFPEGPQSRAGQQRCLGHQRHGYPWCGYAQCGQIPLSGSEGSQRHNLALKAKYERMKSEEVLYEAYNTDGDYRFLIVILRHHEPGLQNRHRYAQDRWDRSWMIRPQTCFPFPDSAIYEAARKTSCTDVWSAIEMSMGQMVDDVERCVKGVKPVQWYGKCGGDVPTPEEIIELMVATLKTRR